MKQQFNFFKSFPNVSAMPIKKKSVPNSNSRPFSCELCYYHFIVNYFIFLITRLVNPNQIWTKQPDLADFHH